MGLGGAPIRDGEEPMKEGDLTEKTLAELKVSFASYGHRPSEEMWIGIRAAVETMEKMAGGNLDGRAYLPPSIPG